MKFVASLLALAVAFTVVGKLSADDAPAKPKHHGMAGPFEMLKGLDLTADQKAKVKEVGKEFHSKMKAAADSVLTDEQKTARDEAVKAAKDAGKKGREVQKAAHDAVKLTAEQKTKMKDAMKPVDKEIREKLMDILTDEQKAQVKKNCEKKACK
jgi:Spy/CpxP family protein refolding chaperone